MQDQAFAQDSPVDAAALAGDADLRAILTGAAAVAIWDAGGREPIWRNRAAQVHPALRDTALATPLRAIARRIGARETVSLERLRHFEGPRAVGLTLAVRSVPLAGGGRGLMTAIAAPQERTAGPGREIAMAEPPAEPSLPVEAPIAAMAEPVATQTAATDQAEAPAPARAGRTRRVRLVWRTDSEGLLVHLSGPRAEALAIGDEAGALPLAGILGTGGLHLRAPLAERRTFTGLPAAWPLAEGGMAPCRISGAPILDEQRMFRGFSGFALIEMPEEEMPPARAPVAAAPVLERAEAASVIERADAAPIIERADAAPAEWDNVKPAAQAFPGWSFGAIAARATFAGAALGGMSQPARADEDEGEPEDEDEAQGAPEAVDAPEPAVAPRAWWTQQDEAREAAHHHDGDDDLGDEASPDEDESEDAPPDDAPPPFSLGWNSPEKLSALLDSIGAAPTAAATDASDAEPVEEDEAGDEGEDDEDLWGEDDEGAEDEDEDEAEDEAEEVTDDLWDEDDEEESAGGTQADVTANAAENEDDLPVGVAWAPEAEAEIESEPEAEARDAADDGIFDDGPVPDGAQAAAARAEDHPDHDRPEAGPVADEGEPALPADAPAQRPDTGPDRSEAPGAGAEVERPSGKVVALHGPEVTPFTLAGHRPDGDGLSATERNAFREIARALGARLEGETPPVEAAAGADAPGTAAREAPGIAAVAPAQAPDEMTAATPSEPPSQPSPKTAAPASPWGAQAEAVLDKLPVGVMVMRGQVPIAMNRTLLDLTGYPDIDSFYEDGGVGRLFHGAAERTSSGTIAVQTREGELIEVDARMQVIDWQGDPATLVSLRRSAEAEMRPKLETLEMELTALQARCRELEAVLDTATDGVVLVDDLGRILSLNRSAEALFGYDQREVAGEPFSVLLAPDSHVAATDYLEGLKSGGVKSVLNDGREVFGRERNGGRIPLFLTIGAVSEGGQRKFCAVLRDMTAWKSAEAELVEARRAAEHASAQKSDFLAKISHEIRTPLSAIIGFAEVMMEERFGPVGNERYREYLRDIHSSGTHVVSLVNDLLDLSKIEAGRMELEFKSVQVNDIVTANVALMQPQAGQARVIVRTSLARKLPPVVADERSLRQIVLNILSNAVKFTDPGGQIIVSTAYTDRGEVTLRVRDTGIGMNEKDLALALEPFRQVATTRRTTGTGLGLPLTKALVEANRAQFTISSVKAEGTLVEITFPATRVLAD
jgi:PAS domain S-box-containing protein